MSLPLAFGARLETIPAEVPYLKADNDLSRQWDGPLAGSDGLKVGIVWAGSVHNSNDSTRSLALSQFGHFAKASAIIFFSLRKGEPTRQALTPPAGMNLVDYSSELRDFADTAALIANLDLVIAPDTAVAHLAGALSKPVWVLLSHAADWRYLLDREDSPRYPTMRLFRQKKAADWARAVERVAQALDGLRRASSKV
jgi:hypothetical protein